MHYVYILLFYDRYHHNIDQEFLRLSLPTFTAGPVVERDYSAADRTCIPLLLFFQKPVYSVFLHIQRLSNETCSIAFSIASVQIPGASAREITAFIAVGYASFSWFQTSERFCGKITFPQIDYGGNLIYDHAIHISTFRGIL